MQMEELNEKTNDLGDHIEGIVQTYYKLTALRLTQKASNLAAGAFVTLSTVILLLFVFLFCSLALAWWLGDIVDDRAIGFLLVAAFDLIILLVLIGIRKKIIFPYIRNRIIKKLYDPED